MTSKHARFQSALTQAIVNFFTSEDLYAEELRIQGTVCVTADRGSIFVTHITETTQRSADSGVVSPGQPSQSEPVEHVQSQSESFTPVSKRSSGFSQPNKHKTQVKPDVCGGYSPVIVNNDDPGFTLPLAKQFFQPTIDNKTEKGMTYNANDDNVPSAEKMHLKEKDPYEKVCSHQKEIKHGKNPLYLQHLPSSIAELPMNLQNTLKTLPEHHLSSCKNEDIVGDYVSLHSPVCAGIDLRNSEPVPKKHKVEIIPNFTGRKKDLKQCASQNDKSYKLVQDENWKPHVMSNHCVSREPNVEQSYISDESLPWHIENQSKGDTLNFLEDWSSSSWVRRPKTKFSAQQLSALEEEYQTDPFLSTSAGRRANLAHRLNLTEKNIQIWFQNQRRRRRAAAYRKMHYVFSESVSVTAGVHNSSPDITNIDQAVTRSPSKPSDICKTQQSKTGPVTNISQNSQLELSGESQSVVTSRSESSDSTSPISVDPSLSTQPTDRVSLTALISPSHLDKKPDVDFLYKSQISVKEENISTCERATGFANVALNLSMKVGSEEISPDAV